jgi:hypothetical protein
MAAVKSGLETLRDYVIVEFLVNRGPGKREISKTDDALFQCRARKRWPLGRVTRIRERACQRAARKCT